MSGQHTPGPWRVEHKSTLIWGACNPDDRTTYGMGYPIAECRISPGSASAWCKGPSAGEGEANARLIAAAPELLEALIALSGNIGAASLARNPHGKMLREKAAAAIAKATGQ